MKITYKYFPFPLDETKGKHPVTSNRVSISLKKKGAVLNQQENLTFRASETEKWKIVPVEIFQL